MKLFKDMDVRPLLLVPVLALLAWPLVGSGSTWLTLTVAGLAMGMIIFIMASGLTLVFGLMDVLNFGHGLFIAIGAYMATTVLGGMTAWTDLADWAATWRPCCPPWASPWRWPPPWAWRLSASSCDRCMASTSSKS